MIKVDQYVPICMEYAKNQINDGIVLEQYKKRHQHNPERIKWNYFVGKIGEFAVYEYLTNLGYECTPPDLTITSDKSYAADLICEGRYIHVKTCEDAPRYRYTRIERSWVFQKNDRLIYNPHPDDFIALCILYENNSSFYVNVWKIIRASFFIKNRLYKPLKVKRLNATKTAIYFDDVARLLLRKKLT